jgi:hypothetical protein
MKRSLILTGLVIMAMLSFAMASNAYAGIWICGGTVKHDGSPVQGAIVKIMQNHCYILGHPTDTTNANGIFYVPTGTPFGAAGNYTAVITNAPHTKYIDFYYSGQGYPTELGTINLGPIEPAEVACPD